MLWEAFPFVPWPRGFGLRERPRPVLVIDPDQIELAHELVVPPRPAPNLVERLRAVIARSRLTLYQFANWVMGCSDVTLYRYLRGRKIPEDRRNWLTRLESATVHGDRVVIIVRCGDVSPRRWPRRRFNWQRMEYESGGT